MASFYQPGPVSRRILCLFQSFGNRDYIGEPISIIAHSLQAGALALEGGDEEVAIAALLHDIGHAVGMEAGFPLGMGGCGHPDHEGVGELFVRDLGFTPRIQKLVKNHVVAKRYLCCRSKKYHDDLSSASKVTLGFQGGPMSEEEAAAFEKDPDFETILAMRRWDEAAKVENLEVAPLDAYFPLIDKYSNLEKKDVPNKYVLSAEQIRFYKENGYLMIPNLLNFDGYSAASIKSWVDEISDWPKADNKWLIHWEENANVAEGKQLCRMENFADYHEKMGNLCNNTLKNAASQLFGEEAKLFKEKVNFKLPGGAGFGCHQDSPAYIGLATDHISVMVAVDASTEANGCLQVSPGWYSAGEIPLTKDGVLTSEAESSLQFTPVLANPGDVMLFSGYLPHRSNPNTTNASRRAMFITYNPASQGDNHTEYYLAKHSGAKGFGTGHTISFQNDFQGRIVD